MVIGGLWLMVRGTAMELRPELMPPKLDEAKVARLGKLAAQLDGGADGPWEEWLDKFNRLAGTDLQFKNFQKIYGAMEHDEWVRDILCRPYAKKLDGVTREEWLEVIRRVMNAAGEEHEQSFWLTLLEENLDPHISDLIFWPGEYFGDGDDSRELSPEQILEIALPSGRHGSS
jgi:hypothetical protein